MYINNEKNLWRRFSMECKNCGSKVDETYRVNELGDVFCGDDCYALFMSESADAPNDFDHPYIDDYELIRSDYIEWLENWESDLNSITNKKILLKIDEMLDTIDEVFNYYWDYYKTGGDDGVFAREIYLYLLKFEELQKQMLKWRPKREFLYYLSFKLNQDTFEEGIMDWKRFSNLLKVMGLNDLYSRLNDHIYSKYDPSFYFKTKEELHTVLLTLNQHFHDEIIEIHTHQVHICNGCHSNRIVIKDVQSINQDSWFYCDSCEPFYYPGFFSKDELKEEIHLHDKWRNLKKNSKKDYWPYYLRKIKRSCRFHEIDYPDWIELNYLI